MLRVVGFLGSKKTLQRTSFKILEIKPKTFVRPTNKFVVKHVNNFSTLNNAATTSVTKLIEQLTHDPTSLDGKQISQVLFALQKHSILDVLPAETIEATFNTLSQHKLVTNDQHFIPIIHVFGKEKNLEKVKFYFKEMTETFRIRPDIVICNLMLSTLIKLSTLEDVTEFFDSMITKYARLPNEKSFQLYLTVLLEKGKEEEALERFNQMRSYRISPKPAHYDAFLHYYERVGKLGEIVKLGKEIMKAGGKVYDEQLPVFCRAYSKSHNWEHLKTILYSVFNGREEPISQEITKELQAIEVKPRKEMDYFSAMQFCYISKNYTRIYSLYDEFTSKYKKSEEIMNMALITYATEGNFQKVFQIYDEIVQAFTLPNPRVIISILKYFLLPKNSYSIQQEAAQLRRIVIKYAGYKRRKRKLNDLGVELQRANNGAEFINTPRENAIRVAMEFINKHR